MSNLFSTYRLMYSSILTCNFSFLYFTFVLDSSEFLSDINLSSLSSPLFDFIFFPWFHIPSSVYIFISEHLCKQRQGNSFFFRWLIHCTLSAMFFYNTVYTFCKFCFLYRTVALFLKKFPKSFV